MRGRDVIEEGGESFQYRGAIHAAQVGQIVWFNPEEATIGQGEDERA